MKILITLILFALLFAANAQSIAPKKTIEIDTLTKLPKESVPFDESFIFKMTAPVDMKSQAYSIEELKRNGQLRPETWKDHKVKFLSTGPTRKLYTTRTDFREAKDFLKTERSNLKTTFKANKKLYPGTTYPVFKEFDKANEKILNKKRKEIYFPIDPIKPSTSYKVTFLSENDDFINDLTKVVSDVDTDLANATLAYSQIVETNFVPGETHLLTSFEEFSNIIHSFALDLSTLTSISSISLRVFIVREDDDSTFDLSKAEAESENSEILIQNSERLLASASNTFKPPTPPKEFIIAFRQLCYVKGEFQIQDLKDSQKRTLIDNQKYRICVLFTDQSKTARLEKSDLLVYNQKKFTPPIVITYKVKIGNSSVDNINKRDDEIAKLNSRLATYTPGVSPLLLPSVIKNLLEIDCSDSQKIIGEVFCKTKDETLKVYRSLPFMPTARLKLLVGGLITFDNISKEEGTENYFERLKNLESTLSSLDRVLIHLKYMLPTASATDMPNILILHDSLQSLNTAIKDRVIPFLTQASKYKQAVVDQLASTQRFVRPASFNSTTEVFEFKSRASFRIVPDFGLIGVMKGDNSFNFTDLVPYLGFNVNLRPINKNIPFSSLRGRRTPLHYLSFMSGVTLTSIAINNEREDLFGKGSLLTGIGIRANNTLKFAAGMLWFKSYNKDPLMKEKKLAFSPYVGLSLDIEIQDLFGGLVRLFK